MSTNSSGKTATTTPPKQQPQQQQQQQQQHQQQQQQQHHQQQSWQLRENRSRVIRPCVLIVSMLMEKTIIGSIYTQQNG